MTRPAGAFADCEVRDTWFLAQDVNAWTSVAYVAAGAAIAVLAVRRRAAAFTALGALTAVEGVGSVWYHGGRGDAARFLHDVGLVGVLGFVAGWHVGRAASTRAGSASRAAVIGAGLAVVVGTATWAAAASSTNAIVGALVALTVAAEVVARRRRRAPVWTVGLVALAAVAVVAWWAGTPGSPLCDAGSWWQPHGLWHVLTALLVMAWAARATAVVDDDHR